MVTIRFIPITIKRKHRYICSKCGKRRTITESFTQTVNPFNKNKVTGLPKTHDEILAELNQEANDWVKPTTCPGCIYAA